MVKPSHLRPLSLDRFLFGVCYYPEHWDAATRKDDVARMREAGIEVIRLAEFAATLLEPEPGRYVFDLFDEVITTFGQAGIQTILGTPTAAPPRWLTTAYPDALAVDAEGRTMQHGSRQHISLSHPAYREYARQISAAMANHYASFPEVIGWQTDNEYHCHFAEDHSLAAQMEFQKFLRERYAHSIDRLNAAWGNIFWSLTYASFEEISTPKTAHPTHPNPSHMLDYARFLSWRAARVQREQIRELRHHQRPDWFIFHNGCFGKIDYRGDFGRDLDFLGYDSYPMFSFTSPPRPAMHAFNLDRARAWTGNFIIPEQQSGPGGQGDYFHDQPEPGEMRKFTYASIAHGADGILYFRWRSCRFGAEMYWCGILDHDNQPRRRLEECRTIGQEIKQLGPEIIGTTVRVDVGLALGAYEAQEAHSTLPRGLPGPAAQAERLHGWFFRQHYAAGCIHPVDTLDTCTLYIIPHWEVFDPVWIEPLTQFVERGGTLLIGARTGTRDGDNQVLDIPPPGPLADLAGVEVAEYSRKNDPQDRPWMMRWDDREGIAEEWVEILAPRPGTDTLATWTTRHAAGKAALTRRRQGRGQVLYAGFGLTETWMENFGFRLIELTGLAPVWPNLPPEVEAVRREKSGTRLWFFINHADTPQELRTTPSGSCRLGPTPVQENGPVTLAPYEVMVFREEIDGS